jgi:DNA polymerase III alpha subunit
MKTRLKEVVYLSIASPEEVQKMFALYRELFNNTASLCASCPDNIRMVQRNLKQYYETYF